MIPTNYYQLYISLEGAEAKKEAQKPMNKPQRPKTPWLILPAGNPFHHPSGSVIALEVIPCPRTS